MRAFLVEPEHGLPAEVRDAILAALAERHETMPAPPEFHAGIAQSERNRFLVTLDRMMEADLLVADASEESHAVAWCLAWFLARGRLAVVACRRDARAKLSPMIAGNPSPWQRVVLYDTPAELQAALASTLRF